MRLVKVADDVWLNPEHVESVEVMTSPASGNSHVEIGMVSGETFKLPAGEITQRVIQELTATPYPSRN